MKETISKSTLRRLPVYLNYLKSMPQEGGLTISATALAVALDRGEVQVRKDLASICNAGKPKIGYLVSDLIEALETFLRFDEANYAIIVGVGKLGRALLEYKGFEKYNMKIVAGFDVDASVVGNEVDGKRIYDMSELANFVKENKTMIGIITIPQTHAQDVADVLVESGIRAIWNFSPAHIVVPKNVALKNENLAVSLAVLANQLKELVKDEK